MKFISKLWAERADQKTCQQQEPISIGFWRWVCLNVAGRDSRVEVAGAGAGAGKGRG